MARTLRQQRLARRIVQAVDKGEPVTKGKLLKDTGYSVSSQNQPKRIIDAVGVQEALEEAGFSEFKAKSVMAGILNSPTIFEMITPSDQIKAAQEVFKVMGSYAPEKSQSLNIELQSQTGNATIKELAERIRKQMREEYERGNNT